MNAAFTQAIPIARVQSLRQAAEKLQGRTGTS